MHAYSHWLIRPDRTPLEPEAALKGRGVGKTDMFDTGDFMQTLITVARLLV
jgi:hypothetical protein